jgi:catechol 2,3-dioxygenase-like lactoylglutathione lyase family enzyme
MPGLGDAPIVAFAATANAGAAKAFYGDVLGLTLIVDDGFALVFDASGTMLRIAKVQAVAPPGYTTLGWHVADPIATATDLAARGVRFERYPGFEQDELGIWSPPGGGSVAWFKDRDGNLLSISS